METGEGICYNVDGSINICFKVDGTVVDCSARLISAETSCCIGKIAAARIVIQDDPLSLEESDSETFPIGSRVEISLGRDDDMQPVFCGIVTDRSLRIGADGAEAVITARHEAFRMTLERHFVCHEDKKDSDIISAIAGDYGIDAKVGDTAATHEKLVQYNCTDWDFINLRAEAAGLLLATTPDGITAAAPDLGAEPVMTISAGGTLSRLQVELSGRERFKSITAEGWNYSSRSVENCDADTSASDAGQGTEKTPDLASGIGNDSRTIRLLSGQITPDAMQQMASAQALKTGLSRITGKVSALGYAGVLPLDMVKLEGLGRRFDGNAPVSSVIQNFSGGGWETTLGIGVEDIPFHTRFTDISSPASDGVTPAACGLQAAIVEALEGDPQGEERIRVKLMGYDTAALWARVASPYAGDGRGFVFLPEIGDEVLVGFMGGSPSEPVVLGALHSSGAPSPDTKSDDNDIKSVVTREGIRIEFDDKKKHVVIATPGGNSVTVSDDEKSVLIQDQNGNKVTLASDGITLDSAKDVAVKAKGDINIEGVNINLKANAQLAAKGSGSAEISSSGNTVVKGSLVQIN